MNRFQKFLNKKANGLLKENPQGRNFRQVRRDWKYAIKHIKFYQTALKEIGITKRQRRNI